MLVIRPAAAVTACDVMLMFGTIRHHGGVGRF